MNETVTVLAGSLFQREGYNCSQTYDNIFLCINECNIIDVLHWVSCFIICLTLDLKDLLCLLSLSKTMIHLGLFSGYVDSFFCSFLFCRLVQSLQVFSRD